MFNIRPSAMLLAVDMYSYCNLWKYDTENHTENLEKRWKSWEQKNWVTLKIWFNFFQYDSSVLDKKGKYFSVIIEAVTSVFFSVWDKCSYCV